MPTGGHYPKNHFQRHFKRYQVKSPKNFHVEIEDIVSSLM